MAITTKELIETWHSDARVDEIAVNYQVSRNAILAAWRQLKINGELPAGDRPRNRQSFLLRGENHSDGRPSVVYDDPLLEALKAGKR